MLTFENKTKIGCARKSIGYEYGCVHLCIQVCVLVGNRENCNSTNLCITWILISIYTLYLIVVGDRSEFN